MCIAATVGTLLPLDWKAWSTLVVIDLKVPSADMYGAWVACVQDFADTARDGSGDWQIEGFAADRETFDALLEITASEADVSKTPSPGHVHCDHFWITDGPDMLGFIAVRHSLDNDFLRTLGGHIGYSIRPSARRAGHATAALALAVRHAREVGLTQVLVTCDEGNTGSARTIEKNNGVFENAMQGKRRYWIACD